MTRAITLGGRLRPAPAPTDEPRCVSTYGCSVAGSCSMSVPVGSVVLGVIGNWLDGQSGVLVLVERPCTIREFESLTCTCIGEMSEIPAGAWYRGTVLEPVKVSSYSSSGYVVRWHVYITPTEEERRREQTIQGR